MDDDEYAARLAHEYRKSTTPGALAAQRASFAELNGFVWDALLLLENLCPNWETATISRENRGRPYDVLDAIEELLWRAGSGKPEGGSND